jgi:hypothetical protein
MGNKVVTLLRGEKVQIINKKWHFFTGINSVIDLGLAANTGDVFDLKKHATLLSRMRERAASSEAAHAISSKQYKA